MPRPPQSSAATASLSDRVYGALLDEAKRRPPPVHLLNVGDTYLEPLPAARAEAQRAADHPRLHNYAAVQGEPVLLDAIVARTERVHGVTLDRQCGLSRFDKLSSSSSASSRGEKFWPFGDS